MTTWKTPSSIWPSSSILPHSSVWPSSSSVSPSSSSVWRTTKFFSGWTHQNTCTTTNFFPGQHNGIVAEEYPPNVQGEIFSGYRERSPAEGGFYGGPAEGSQVRSMPRLGVQQYQIEHIIEKIYLLK